VEVSGASVPAGRDLPIIDAHQHFWDLSANYLPWLCDQPPIPFRYGDYSAIRRDYLPDDYRRDTQAFNLAGSVFIETEWDRRDPVGETRWVAALRQRDGLPSAMVCHVPLDRPEAADIMAEQASFPFVRGVRHKPFAAASPEGVEPGAPGSMGDPRWRRGYARLAEHDLSFDLQTPWWHLDEALALNRDFPDTKIILNHSGLPSDRSTDGLQHWRQAMSRFAAAPNVAVKISGLGQPGRHWSITDNREIILTIIDTFGADRCMFASNYPVDSLVGEFVTIFDGFFAATAGLGHVIQSKLFAGTARRVYRLE
jgi:predicted TIM-barrel fold metal-dependent hydrolase